MGQYSWIYLDHVGGRHNVGIYHGEDSGNVIIYCNGQIVNIALDTGDNNLYSFFINGQLCEIQIRKGSDGYEYDFFLNTKADTPLNRAMRKREIIDTSLGIGLFLVVLAIIFAVVFSLA